MAVPAHNNVPRCTPTADTKKYCLSLDILTFKQHNSQYTLQQLPKSSGHDTQVDTIGNMKILVCLCLTMIINVPVVQNARR